MVYLELTLIVVMSEQLFHWLFYHFVVEIGPSTSVEYLAGEVATVIGTFDERHLGSEVSTVPGADEQLEIEVLTEHENFLVIYGHA